MLKYQKNISLFTILFCFLSLSTFSQSEICGNGIDDDNDGLVDCFDDDCFDSVYCENFYYGPDSPCEDRPPVDNSFGIALKWQTDDAYYLDQRCNSYVGDMDSDGTPDIVSKTGSGTGYIRIFDGKTGDLKQSINCINSHPFSEPAIGDVDGNGLGDVFVVGGGGAIARYEYGNPNPIWINFSEPTAGQETTPQLADFNADGYPEVYVGNRIYSAITGTRFTVDNLNTGKQPGINDRYSLAYDIFKPGDQKPNGGFFGNEADGLELIAGNQVLLVELGNGSIDGGQVTIAAEITGTNINDGFVSIADINNDFLPDIMVSSAQYIYAWNPYTEDILLRPFATAGNDRNGRSCLGNFDNDPEIELGVVSRHNLTVFDLNTVSKTFQTKWNKTVDDQSSLTSCTLFDFNGDSKNEVVYSDQEYLYILNGSNGGELARVVCRSGTRTEYPVIADVDNDGHAEIVMTAQNINGPANSTQSYIRVYQSPIDNWMPTRKVWNQHGYFITNVNDDLTIPIQQQTHVSAQLNDIFNGFLMQLSPKDTDGNPIQPVADVTANQIESDNSNCPDEVTISIEIDNIGETSFPIGMPISVYKGDPFNDLTATLISTNYYPAAIVNGVLETYLVTISDIVGFPADIYIVLNDNGALSIPINFDNFPNSGMIECDYTNNVIHLLVSCTEICGNGIDDDNDGLADCEDPDCAVEGSSYTATICALDSFPFAGEFLTEAGIYFDTIPSTFAGCDSIITLELLQADPTFETSTVSICENELYDFNGTMLSESGFYHDSLRTTMDCDSVIQLILLVYPIENTITEIEICEGDLYNFQGIDYSETGIYSDTILSSFDCDSILTLNLTVNPIYETAIVQTICIGQSYPFGDDLLTETGIYDANFSTSDNCDSTVTLTLSVLDLIEIEINEHICSGETYLFNGISESETGTYYNTSISTAGCDSLTTLHLSVIDELFEDIEQTICEGESYPFGDLVYSESGIFNHTFESVAGCDSTVTLTLVVNGAFETIIDTTLCDLETIQVGTETYSESGNYNIPLSSASGCDSIILLSIEHHDSFELDLDESICEGEGYDFGSETLMETGIYVQNLMTEAGCDSTITLNLIVNSNKENNISERICFGQDFTIWDDIFDESGTYEKHFETSFGCDSLVYLVLEIDEKLETFIEKEICDNTVFEIDGNTYTETGVYSYILEAERGCDSIMNIDLQVFQNYQFDIQEEICEGESFSVNGEAFTESGIFNINLQTQNGCDSTYVLDLTVYPIYRTPILESICENDTFFFQNMTFTKSGIYDIDLQSIDGCDSIIELQIEIFDLPEVEITGNKIFCKGEAITLNATKNYPKYEWNDESSNNFLSIEDGGIYTVTVTDEHNCKMSASIDVDPPIELIIDYLPTSPACYEANNGSIEINQISGGLAPYITSINGENFENQLEFFDLQPGTYQIIVSDANKCVWQEEIFLDFPSELYIDLESDIELNIGDSIQMNVYTNFVPKYTIWTPETGLSCTDCLNPYVTNFDSEIYTITMFDEFGCMVENRVILDVINEHNIYIPSGFTPNGDGTNDVFTIYSDVNIQQIDILQVFDRWGNLVFEQSNFQPNDIQFGWDGTFKGETMNPAVFAYYTLVTFLDGTQELFKGDVTIIK